MDNSDAATTQEVIIDTQQPEQVVATSSEVKQDAEGQPQPKAEANTDDGLIIIDSVEDANKGKPDPEIARKKALERKQKREAKAARQAAFERQKKLNETLVNKVNELSRGERPDPYDYDNKQEFYKALDAWNSQVAVDTTQFENKPEQQAQHIDDEAQVMAESQYESLSKLAPDFYQAKEDLEGYLTSQGLPDVELFNNNINTFARQGVDMAKARYAISKVPELKTELVNLLRSNANDIEYYKLLDKAQNKVKLRTGTVQSKPEPEINQSSSTAQSLEALKVAYYEDMTNVEKGNAYFAAKRAAGN